MSNPYIMKKINILDLAPFCSNNSWNIQFSPKHRGFGCVTCNEITIEVDLPEIYFKCFIHIYLILECLHKYMQYVCY